MSGGFVSRRRADEFDALLSAPDGRGAADDPRVQELLELVGSLRSVPTVTARPEFVATLRSQLVAAAEAQPARQVDAATVARLTPTQRRGRGERRLAAALGGFAVVAATGSMAMASQSALPGDALYPVKRAIENAHTNLQSDDAGKAATLLDHAAQRLAEVEALNARGGDADEIAATLQDFSEQTNQATSLALSDYDASGDETSLQDVRDFAGSSMDELTDLGDEVPEEARPALITAAQSVRQADSAAENACPTCEGEEINGLPEIATRSLDRLLGAEQAEEIAAQTPVTAPATPHRRHQQRNHDSGTKAGSTPTETTTTDPLDTTDDALPDVGDETTDPLKETVDGVTKGLLGDGDTSNGGDDLADNVVNGVTGLLGGLTQ